MSYLISDDHAIDVLNGGPCGVHERKFERYDGGLFICKKAKHHKDRWKIIYEYVVVLPQKGVVFRGTDTLGNATVKTAGLEF